VHDRAELETRVWLRAGTRSSARCERHQACATMSQWGPTGQSTPNYNAEADGMASIISHELTEAVTDPELNAWCARARPACTVTLRWPQLKVMQWI